MQIGIIGVGSVTLGLAQRAAQSGHKVLISNPRGNNPLKDVVNQIGKNAKLVSTKKAASAGTVILFSPLEELEILVQDFPDMTGKVILHTNNPIFNFKSFISASEHDYLHEYVASLLPTAGVVKVYNVLLPLGGWSCKDCQEEEKTEIFFSGKNKSAKSDAKVFLESLNYSAVDILSAHKIKSWIEIP